MAVRKRPATARRKPALRLVSKPVGTDGKGRHWVLVWAPNNKALKIGGCLTDAFLEKRKAGCKPQRKLPTAHAGKGGAGRLELKSPRGLPQPWGGAKGDLRPYWHRLLAWYFVPKARRPTGLTLEQFFEKEGMQYKWAAPLILRIARIFFEARAICNAYKHNFIVAWFPQM